MRTDEFNKPKNAVKMWAAITLFAFACAFGLFSFGINRIKHSGGRSSVSKVENSSAVTADLSRLKIVPNPSVGTTVPSLPGYQWVSLPVSGYLEKGGRLYLIVNNSIQMMDGRFRNFDPLQLTVEYKTVVQESRAKSGEQAQPARVAAN